MELLAVLEYYDLLPWESPHEYRIDDIVSSALTALRDAVADGDRPDVLILQVLVDK